jgi:hypothetical protein
VNASAKPLLDLFGIAELAESYALHGTNVTHNVSQSQTVLENCIANPVRSE